MEWFGSLFGVWRTTSSDSVSDGARGSNVESPSREESASSPKEFNCEEDIESIQNEVSSKEESVIPSSQPPQSLSCQNDAVQVLVKSPSNEEPAPSQPNSCNPATPVSRQERRRKERERKKRERKSESVLYGPHANSVNNRLLPLDSTHIHKERVCLSL
jgi:hypothetical protein